MSAGDVVRAGGAALAEGRWTDARTALEATLEDEETAEACFGLAIALWWLGENRASVTRCTRAYSLYRRAGEAARAAECAIWLGVTYKANFANYAAANGWVGRADRLLEPLERQPLHGWALVARAYRMADLDTAEELTARAVEIARSAGDLDLELVAISQLGLIGVGKGDTAAGFALIDEAMAAVLAGEPSNLDTAVYACCDMLNACELASDAERAAQWCKVADDFVETYGCPFLYAECRIYYGSLLIAQGRWTDAERELHAGLRITEDACPALHARALTRLAGLRVRQGRLEEAEALLSEVEVGLEADMETIVSVAALLLARGDAAAASCHLEPRSRLLDAHRTQLGAALDLLADSYLASGSVDEATATVERLVALAGGAESERLTAVADAARGRVSIACGDLDAGAAALRRALDTWSRLHLPFEAARAQLDLGRGLASTHPDLAVDHARRALASFEDLGAGLEADRVAAFLRSLGVTARTGPKGVGLLTRREQEVLRLLGGGLSNPEIAERLHVSRKTASHHVSSILMKLSLRNRAQAAAYAASEVDGMAHRQG